MKYDHSAFVIILLLSAAVGLAMIVGLIWSMLDAGKALGFW